MAYDSLRVKVWGDLACFSRPEMKVERVSYEVMTPSAARGILESIFWKPEMQWEVRAIHVLRPVRFLAFVRNEVARKATPGTALCWAELHSADGYFIDDNDIRTQRHTLALRDVAYLIVADIRVLPRVQADAAKYRDQFRRRIHLGQCHSMPYLGCREFVACFSELDGQDQPIPVNADLGRMLFDLDYEPGESGRGRPRFFEAQLERGILHVPAWLYEEQKRRRQDAASTLA
jgi:CRISPR-associated protein Cas5d